MAKKTNVKRIILSVTASVLFLCVTFWFALTAYIHVNYHTSIDYKEGVVTKYVAHRGLSSEYYQNTYDAFFFASNGTFFGGIECDIWRTLDGVWVCCHDDTPFVDKTVKVSENNFADIENLPLDITDRGEFVDGDKDIFITTYAKYLSIMRYTRKKAFVEIKYQYSQEIISELVEYTADKTVISRVVFCSFNKKVIDRVIYKNKLVTVMVLSNVLNISYLYAKMGFSLGLNKTLLDKRQSRIELLHDNNSFVYVYTVNTSEEAQKYEDMGVDYIATDYVLD